MPKKIVKEKKPLKPKVKKKIDGASTKPKKKARKWTLRKSTGPVNRKNEIDLEDDTEINMSSNNGVDETTSSEEVSDDEVIEEVEVVNSTTDTLESLEDSETFSLAGSNEDGGGRLESIRSNPKPKGSWVDKTKPLFVPGDLVVPIELTKKEALEFEPYKIVGPSSQIESYFIKKSGVMRESIVYSDEVKLAPKNGKPFISYWDTINPFKIPGVKITCPSNNK